MPSYLQLHKILNELYENNFDEGFCMGFALMGVQAFLCGEDQFEKFKSRIDFIIKNPDFFAKEQKQVKTINSPVIEKLNYFFTHNFFSNSSTKPTYAKIKNIIVEKRHKAREKSQTGKQAIPEDSKVEMDLNKMEQTVIDITAFFDGIALYQGSEIYVNFLHKSLHPLHLVEISQYTQSKQLEDLGGLINPASFMGIYDKNELKKYINILNKSVINITCEIAFGLFSGENAHAIALCFSRKQWWLINFNSPGIQMLKSDDLADRVFKALTRSNRDSSTSIGMITKVLATAHNEQILIDFINVLKQSVDFIELHEIAPQNANRLASNKDSLAYLAARINDSDSLTKLINLNSQFLDKPEENSMMTPTGEAIRAKSVECLQALVNATNAEGVYSIDLNKPDGQREGGGSLTAICLAVDFESLGCLQVLIDAKTADGGYRVDLDQSDELGNTPTHLAAIQNRAQPLRMLLATKTPDGKCRVDPNKKDKAGFTAAHFAAKEGNRKILEILEAHDADLEAEDNQGRKPVDLARIENKLNVVEFYELREKRSANAARKK